MELKVNEIGKAYFSENKESGIIEFEWTVFGLKVQIFTWSYSLIPFAAF